MSIYLLALCALPCGDNIECEDSEAHQVSVNLKNKDHEHPQEACTPFCYCACCAASVIYQPIPLTSSIGQIHQRHEIGFKIRIYNSDFHSFWQPPKLS